MQRLTTEKLDEMIIWASKWQVAHALEKHIFQQKFLAMFERYGVAFLCKARERMLQEQPDALIEENRKLRDQIKDAHDLLEQTQDMDAKKFFHDLSVYSQKWGWR